MKKRFISLFLVMALTLPFSTGTYAASDEGNLANFKPSATYVDGQFSDVKASDWCAAGV